MTAENYDEAVAYASQKVAEWVAWDAQAHVQDPKHVALWWLCGVRACSSPDGFEYLDAPIASIATICEMAVDDASARVLLTEIVSSKLIARVALHPLESLFAGSVLGGFLPALPKKTGQKRETKFRRNVFLVYLVTDIRLRFALDRTRNDEAKHSHSGCDAVSDAFARNGRHEVTFRAVKDVMNDRRLRKIIEYITAAMDANREPPSLSALAGYPATFLLPIPEGL